MTNKTINFYKVTALPSSIEPNSIYFVAPTGAPADYLEVYVSSSDGAATRHIPTKAEITSWINAGLATAGQIKVVADIAARDALGLTASAWVYVKNATGDSSVHSGGATYLFDASNSTWVKTSEAESLDIALTWDALTGKPSSSPTSIDDAVNKSHTHDNKTQLDKVSEDADGNLTYAGSLPHVGIDGTVGW